jgi:isoleucyl-tRNA synthetase
MRPPDDMHTLSNGYPYDTSYWKEWFPADLITENFPGQFRNWFYAILTMSTVLENTPPYKVLHSYASLRDEHGEEMHKSKGNAIWSDEAAEKIGADVMRWLFARQSIVQNLNFGYNLATEIKRTLLTLWNVYSFFVTYANIDSFNPAGKTIHTATLTKLDKWILSRLNTLIKNCETYYENYDTTSIVKAAEKFFDEISNWYVRRSRRRFWKSESDADKETAYIVLYTCLVKLLKTIAPIMPFFTEHMYQNLVKSVDTNAPESIHLCDFPQVDTERIDEKLENEVSLTRTIVSLGRAARNKVNLKIRQPLAEMRIRLPKESAALSEDDRSIILEELNIKTITAVGEKVLDELLTLSATPNFPVLGPKLGASLNDVAARIKALEQKEIQHFLNTGMLKVDINGTSVEITKEDVDVKEVGKPGWSIAAEEPHGVALNTALSKELEYEGLVRELIHKIQLMRKEANFNLVDRIIVYYQTEPTLKDAIASNIDHLKNETLAIEVNEGTADGEITKELNINKIKTTVVLQRAKK